MNVNEINAYLRRAREIIGDRSLSEIAYDDSVVAHLGRGKDIKRAIRAANQEHPEEALEPGPEHWTDLAARYEYILEHKAILKTLARQTAEPLAPGSSSPAPDPPAGLAGASP